MAKRAGVVLAAGFGSRLAGVSPRTTIKPLTPVAGIPLLVRTLRSLEIAGCDRLVVVLGFGADDIRAEIGEAYRGKAELLFAFNSMFERKNGLSVLAAKELATDPFVLTMADHVLGDEVMLLAGAHTPPEDGATLLVDSKIDTIFDMDDATKVLAHDGRISRIGKTIPEFNCIDCGVFVCTHALLQAINAVYEQTGDASLSDGVQTLASQGRMAVLDIGDGFWQDVDNPEMLAHAEAQLRARQRRAT